MLYVVAILSFFSNYSQAALVAAPVVNAPTAATAVSNQSPIKSYREWKASMINDAEQRVKATKENFFKRRASASSDPNLNRNSKLEAGLNADLLDVLDKEQLQLSLAKDLTISDYFVGYLTKQKHLSQAIKEVSIRLTAEEVAELMTAYADNFFSTKPTPTTSAPRADSGL
jgi:hypothetical protein